MGNWRRLKVEKTAFDIALREKTARLNGILEKFLPAGEGLQKTVIEAMNYSVRAGGKRLRPMLLWETFLLCGGKETDGASVEPFLAAIELIHTYSLVHDDLPAMDNDEYRRGKKTTWAVYGEAVGILAGDGLLNYAFETAVKSFQTGVQPERAAKALSILAGKAGIYGMIGGQTADIEAEGKPVTREQLLFIHENKTAALIQAAMMTGGVLAGADGETLARLEKCAYNIGVAFQIQDDILDVEGNSAELGKQTGSDAQNGKQTYVTLKGMEQAKKDVADLSGEAVLLLDGIRGENPFLRQLVLELICRRS